jgi:pimeloyl-ACP methyl ester carboxylesterase
MPQVGRVHYLEALPGRSARARGTLVLLHAFPLNARMWEPQLELAAEGWHILAPQARGVDGAQGGAADVTSLDDYAADLVDLLDALHIDDVVVVGLSMGGYLAFALLRLAPAYVRGLVLADTRPQADTPEGLEGRKQLLELVRENGDERKRGPAAIADQMIPKLVGETTHQGHPDIVERVRALILANSSESIAAMIRALMSRPDSTPLLTDLRLPTLVMVGEEDLLTPPLVAKAMHQSIGGSELIVIPAAGHLSNLEQPEAFNAALARFLSHRI